MAVRVPGSSANLGPGFDVFGVAIALYLEARISKRDSSTPLVRCTGPHSEGIAGDDSNLILQAFRTAFEYRGKIAPHVCLELHNEIPLARGLGSSGAAAVAGVVLADDCGRLGLTAAEQISIAASLEGGHPDNVAASLLGGFTLACRDDAAEGGMRVLGLPWPEAIGILVAIPEVRLATAKARAVLPNEYRRTDVVFNLQRAALFAGAIASGARDPEVLRTALADRVHQPYRAPLVPGLREATQLRVPGLLGVVLSGAGPSLIAFTAGDAAPAKHALEQIYGAAGVPCEVRSLAVAAQGATKIESFSH